MTAWRFVRTAVVLFLGSGVLVGLYWTLLNVPESSVTALLLSALLALMLALVMGTTLALAMAASGGLPAGQAAGRARAALPLFIVGVGVFAALWFVTTSFDAWWAAHRGEADALAIRYLGITRTEPAHTAVSWISWLLRWVLSLSAVLGLVASAVARRTSPLRSGLREAVRLWPLLSATTGVLLVTRGLWRLTPWRPHGLPPTQGEVYFSAAKLGTLALLALLITTAVVSVYQRSVARRP